jgi:protein ImuA
MPALARTASLVLQDIHADVWHAHALATSPLPVQRSGHAALDAHLPGGGWPVGALTEILQPQGVHSEWRLLLPALARCGQGAVLLVGAPHLPFAPALAAQGLQPQRVLCVNASAAAARLWAAEQALRCAGVDAVLAWLPQARSDQLRRLQMAASEYNKLLFVMRPAAAQDDASPAVLRLHVQPQPSASALPASPRRQAAPLASQVPVWDGLQVGLLKRRGPPLPDPLHLQARTPRLQMQLAASQAYALDRLTARA